MGWYFSLEPGTFEWFFILILWAGLAFSSIVFMIHVYHDSQKKKIKDAEIFILIVLLLNMLGLVFYLVLRGSYPRYK
ncbi:MAG: hypothetical protein ACFFKA_00540 [Candidatus Thorarchaeota archaeon]